MLVYTVITNIVYTYTYVYICVGVCAHVIYGVYNVCRFFVYVHILYTVRILYIDTLYIHTSRICSICVYFFFCFCTHHLYGHHIYTHVVYEH